MHRQLILFFCFAWQMAIAQQEQKIEITKNLFIKDAMVVSSPESTPIKQCLVIRDGIITQIGTDIKPPYDCKIVNADSLFAYAGFIDAMSHTGIKKEEENKDAPKPNSRGEANYKQSGITPQIEALSRLSIKESSITDMRKTGFTTSHVFPKGRMMGGKSSIITLSNVDLEDKLILRNNVGLHSSFTTAADGLSPATVIGVFAKYRELYKNVAIYDKNKTAYDLNPTGLSRPLYHDELNALIPVMKKEQTVFFVTKNVKEVYRAIELQKEIGFKMVLAEVKNATTALDKIKTGNYPILLSLDLPEEIKEDKKTDSTRIDSTKKQVVKEISQEMKSLEERKKTSYNDCLNQASMLEKNNILFSFSYLDAKTGDILKSVKRYIKAGLTQKSALAALTTTPAQLLNISSTHGTIATGKTANLVLTQKPLFDEKSSIKYVIVDGKVFEYYESSKNAESKSSKSKSEVEGTWTYSVETPGQSNKGTIGIKKSGDTFEVKVKQDDQSETYTGDEVIIEGNKIAFSIHVNFGQPMKIEFNYTLDGDKFSGEVIVGSLGTFTITGNKKNNPDKTF